MKGNQSGAALMIVLFLVVLISIVGTAMLSTTTYGLKNVVKTTKEQEEFYRAEGALEIVLSEMNNYKNTTTGNKGPLGYLLEKPKTVIYPVGGENIIVTINTVPSVTSTNIPDNVDITLMANYENYNKSELSRTMKFTVNVNPEELPSYLKAYNYQTPDNHFESRTGTPILNNYGSTATYLEIFNNLESVYEKGKNINSIETYQIPLDNQIILIDDDIKLSGGETLTIPENCILFTKSLTIAGNGNNMTQLIINGALIAEKIYHKGNSIMTVNSGIIAQNVYGDSNRFDIDGKGKGISCTLLPEACKNVTQPTSADKYSSIINQSSIEFSTNR